MITPFNTHNHTLFDEVTTKYNYHNGHADDHFFLKIKGGGCNPRNPPPLDPPVLCQEEDVGYVDLWDSFVGIEGMYARDGLHLSGKGAAAFAEGLSGAVASGLGKVRYLN